MKNLVFISILITLITTVSCKKDNNTIVKMRINHYQQPLNYMEYFYGMAYVIQKDNKINSQDWETLANNIKGFDYETGYIYDIEVKEKPADEHLEDHPNVYYTLHKVISKTKIPSETTFKILFDKSVLTKDDNSIYSFVNKTIIDCNNDCEKLENIDEKMTMRGSFHHVDNKTIRLLDISEYK